MQRSIIWDCNVVEEAGEEVGDEGGKEVRMLRRVPHLCPNYLINKKL
jgi:hypothetical protein